MQSTLYYRLSYTLLHYHSLLEREEFDVITMLRLPESHQTSDMHDLSMIFDQQDLFTTNGAIDCYNCLDVISFSRTFNDFTFKLFDGFLFMKYEEFYQDIYNNNISMDTISSFCQFPDIVSDRTSFI